MRPLLSVLFVLLFTTVRATDAAPEPFVSLFYARYDADFYDRQAEDWKAIATGDCATDEAWWHYYKTARYSNRFANAKNCLLANFNTFLLLTIEDVLPNPHGPTSLTDRQIDALIAANQELVNTGCENVAKVAADGGIVTVHTGAYSPNDYGLYNMAGNAAEMLAEDGKIMGGSWLDPLNHMRKSSRCTTRSLFPGRRPLSATARSATRYWWRYPRWSTWRWWIRCTYRCRWGGRGWR